MPKLDVTTQNNINYIKIDLGVSYYLGPIDVKLFHDELKTDHIEIIKKSFLFFKKESTEQPSIISALEFDEGAVDNNFMICFSVKCMYMNTQKIIKIPVKKYNKVIEDYINEQSQRLDALEKGEANIQLLNTLDQKINNLDQKITNQETIFNNQIKNLIDLIKNQQNKLTNTNPSSNISFTSPQNNTTSSFTLPTSNTTSSFTIPTNNTISSFTLPTSNTTSSFTLPTSNTTSSAVNITNKK